MLVVLLVHAVARAHLSQGLWRFGESSFLDRSDELPENVSVLAPPKDLDDAGIWMLVACQSLLRNRELAPEQARVLARVAESAGQAETSNAFWPQMASLLAWRAGDFEAARRAWGLASLRERWDDRQTSRLERILAGLRREEGATMAWHYAFAYGKRSRAPAEALYRHARAMLAAPPQDRSEKLRFQLETIRNGELLRDGSRASRIADYGVAIVNLGATANDLGGAKAPRELLLARESFADELRENLSAEAAARADKAFVANDAWQALVYTPRSAEEARSAAAEAVFVATLPGALLWSGVLGWLAFAGGLVLGRSAGSGRGVLPWVAVSIGLAMAAAAFWWSRMVFPSIWFLLSFSLFALPVRVRRGQTPGDLGPLFGVVHFVLAMVGGSIATLFLVGMTTAGVYLIDSLGVSDSWGTGSTVLLLLLGILGTLALATGPLWAAILGCRVRATTSLALVRFGAYLGIVFVALGVIGTPIAIAVDRSLSIKLSMLFENEPTYILTR